MVSSLLWDTKQNLARSVCAPIDALLTGKHTHAELLCRRFVFSSHCILGVAFFRRDPLMAYFSFEAMDVID